MIRGGLAAMVAATALFLTQTSVHAADPIIVDLEIDSPRVVTVGDRVGYVIVVEVDAGTGVALAAAGLPPEVALVDAPEVERVPLGNGRETVTISFELAPFVAGEILLPSLPVRYSSPDGSSGVLQTAGSIIDVTSVLPAAGQVTPRDLKAQAQVGTPPPAWPVPVLGGMVAIFVLLIMTALVRRRVVRYQETRALRRVAVASGPEDVARLSLDEAGAEFSASGDLVAYYGSLGNTVRSYLTERYGFPAFALTTRELEAEMARQGVDRWQVRVASGLLEQCDAVVYARYRPAAERADADLTAAYEVVEMSRPDERAVETREEAPVS